jgi:hypothetical protein
LRTILGCATLRRTAAVTELNSPRDNRTLVACFTALVIATGCAESGRSFGSPTGPNAPALQTFNLSGRVTESGASAVFPIIGAVLTIDEGANAGKSATTNASGEYAFSELRREAFSVNISASGYITGSFSIDVQGGATRDFALSLRTPRAPFGAGQLRVGDQIIAGRYFTDPLQTGCYWERQRGFSGTLGDIIANRFVGYDGMQYIVDILGSDVAFKSDPKCGTWFDTPRHGPQSSIPAGVWLVGSQVAPGTYQVTPTASCYWERLRHFQHQGNTGVIANGFGAPGKTQSVTIAATDVGFGTDTNCGTWARVSSAAHAQGDTTFQQSLADIERNRALYEEGVRHPRVR